MQNVNTSQTPLQRLLRVGTVDFDTAGTDDSEFRFVGVANPRAIVTVVDDAVARRPSHSQAGLDRRPGSPCRRPRAARRPCRSAPT